MHHPVADILRIFEGGDYGEHPLLLPEFEVGLEAHQVIDAALGVVLAQLHHGVGLPPGGGVLEAPGLQGAVPEGVFPPPGHHLHGHTTFKDVLVLKAVDLRLLGMAQLLPEGSVLLLGERAVDIIRCSLVVPGGEPGSRHVDAVEGDQGGRRVEEVEGGALPEESGEAGGEGVAGEGTGGNDHLSLRQLRHLPLLHGDEGVAADFFGDIGRKAVAVHRKGPAGLHPGGVRRLQDKAPQAAQFLLEKAHRVLQARPPQGVGAHQLREVRRLMGRGHLLRLHFPQRHGNAPLGQLPGSLAARQTGADHSYLHVFYPRLVSGFVAAAHQIVQGHLEVIRQGDQIGKIGVVLPALIKLVGPQRYT